MVEGWALIQIQRHSARSLPTYQPSAVQYHLLHTLRLHSVILGSSLCRFPFPQPPLQLQCQVMMEVKIAKCAADGGWSWYVVVPLSKNEKFRKGGEREEEDEETK